MRDTKAVLPFDTAVYDQLPISCLIYEPVVPDDGDPDYRVVYVNEVFQRDWYALQGQGDVIGTLLRKNAMLDGYSLSMMDRFLTEQPFSFVTHLVRSTTYLHLEPITNLPRPYAGFFITNITEYERREQTNDAVREMLLSKILVRQFDMVSYILGGTYGVTIGDPRRITRGSIFPHERYGLYAHYLETQVFPVLHGDEKRRAAVREALSLEMIEKQTAISEPYIVDIMIDLNGQTFNKRFNFYAADPAAHFYIVLKSDTTAIYQEQEARNSQMRVALQEAREANVAKTTFLSSMSHEIRTPMNAIIGLDRIALNDPDLPAQTREHLEKNGVSAQHLLSLINDILDMSRIESGRMTLKHSEFSFHDFLDQVNTVISSQCQDKGLRYDCRVIGSPDDYYVGDEIKLKQVLINILGNAVKFTPVPGDVTLTVECRGKLHEMASLSFRIEDTGIGMDREYLKKIFEPFSQEEVSTTNRYGGSGLGLAITKNIVDLMNGEITVASEKGVGSCFTVTVPLRESNRTGRGVGEVNLSDRHVLVIDDDRIAAEHVKLLLAEIGVSSDIALSGRHGLEMLQIASARGSGYDVILLDLRMPEEDGIEVAKQIKAVSGEVAIILATSYSWADLEDEARAAGVEDFLNKPLNIHDITLALRRVSARIERAREERSAVDLKGKRVLLAEDIEINAEIMTMILESMGMEVEIAENGQIAVELFTRKGAGFFDAILMDMRMPVMDGLEATRTIRACGCADSGSIPIIALTANAFDEDVQNALQAGMDAFLTKPVDPDTLEETLKKLL